MECRNVKCRAELPEGAVFCPKCGKKQVITKTRKKRGNGQGTAIKRGKTWTAVWTERMVIVDEGNKFRQVQRWKGGFPTETKALAYAANPPKDDAAASRTLRFYYNGWRKGPYLDLSKSKQVAFDIAWGKLKEIADREISTLTINDLQDTVDKKASTFYPAKDMKTLLSHLFTRAAAQQDVKSNLAAFIRLPNLEEKEAVPFTENELKVMWEEYGKDNNMILGDILLMIYTGMMPGELLNMEPSMVDWNAREIVGAGLKTKTRKKTPIVFPEFLDPVLTNLCNAAGDGKIVNMGKNQFYDAFHATLQKIGVRDLTPYSCRHTTATALALGNIAPSVIQKVMRHSKFSTTERYIHPDTASAHAAVNAIKKGLPTDRTEES